MITDSENVFQASTPLFLEFLIPIPCRIIMSFNKTSFIMMQTEVLKDVLSMKIEIKSFKSIILQPTSLLNFFDMNMITVKQ